MTKNNIFFVSSFFALCFFVFPVFGVEWDLSCEASKSICISTLGDATRYIASSYQSCGDIIDRTTDSSIHSDVVNIINHLSNAESDLETVKEIVSQIDCSATNDVCIDLFPVLEICSNIYSVVRSQYSFLVSVSNDLSYLASVFSYGTPNSVMGDLLITPPAYLNVKDEYALEGLDSLSSVVSNSFNSYLVAFSSFTDAFNRFHAGFRGYSMLFDTYFSDIVDNISGIFNLVNDIYTYLFQIHGLLNQYLPYVKTISDDFKNFLDIYTNSTTSSFSYPTNLFKSSSLLSFDRFRYYAQGQLNNTQPSLYPLSPYDNMQNLRNATIYDIVAGGFESLLISQGSINNYLYWLKAIAGSNRLESVENHIMAVSNLVGRLDDYVLTDFSNEIARISYNLSYLTNRVDYTTNLVHLTELVETNNTFLSSIDSKLDVLDYIKILSTSPLSAYSGDVDYYDYLTNLYINGSSDSRSVSTNWFERMEILLASLVFGDSDGTNGIPQGVEMEGVDSSAVESALTDFSYSSDFTSGINSLDHTKENFFQILNSFHQSVKSVSCPASVSIGIGGLDGEDTRDFNDLMHGHFQVSFSVGSADIFTTVVRSVTTICWVLVFLVIFWKAGFWLLRKMIYLYRVVNRLFWSVFTR